MLTAPVFDAICYNGMLLLVVLMVPLAISVYTQFEIKRSLKVSLPVLPIMLLTAALAFFLAACMCLVVRA